MSLLKEQDQISEKELNEEDIRNRSNMVKLGGWDIYTLLLLLLSRFSRVRLCS